MTISTVETLQVIYEDDYESTVENNQDDVLSSLPLPVRSTRYVDTSSTHLVRGGRARYYSDLTTENEKLRAHLAVLSNELAQADTEKHRWRAQFLQIQKERDSYQREIEYFGSTPCRNNMPISPIIDNNVPRATSFDEAVKANSYLNERTNRQHLASAPLIPSKLSLSPAIGIPTHRGRLREQKSHKSSLISTQAIGISPSATNIPGNEVISESAYYSPGGHGISLPIQPIQPPRHKRINGSNTEVPHSTDLTPLMEFTTLSRSSSTSSASSNSPSPLSGSDSLSRSTSISSVSSSSYFSTQAQSCQSSPLSVNMQSPEFDTALRGLALQDHDANMQLFVNTRNTGMDDRIANGNSDLKTVPGTWNGRGGDVERRVNTHSYPPMAVIPRFRHMQRGWNAGDSTQLSPPNQLYNNIPVPNVRHDAGHLAFTARTSAPTSLVDAEDVAAPFESVNSVHCSLSHPSTTFSGGRQRPNKTVFISGTDDMSKLTPNGCSSFLKNGDESFSSNVNVTGHLAAGNNQSTIPWPRSPASPYSLRPPSPTTTPFSPTGNSSPSRRSLPRTLSSPDASLTTSALSPCLQSSHIVQDDPEYGPVIVHGLLPSRHGGSDPAATRRRKEVFIVPPRHLRRNDTGRVDART